MTDFHNEENIHQLPENKLQAFNLHAETVVEFNHWLAAGPTSYIYREGLSVSVTGLLFDLLEQWSTCNKTLHYWTHAEIKDFGNVIFIHAYYEPADVMLQIGMNEEGIYLQMTITLPEVDSITLSDNFKKGLLQLSHLGYFELGEDHDDFFIMWPYSSYSVMEVLTNGSIAFALMYVLSQQLKIVNTAR